MFDSVLPVNSVRDGGVVGGLEEMVVEKIVEGGEEEEEEEVVVVKRPTVKVRLSLAPDPLLPAKTYSSI